MKIKIEKLVFSGDGLGFIDGKAVFVPFTVPEDEVVVDIVKEHKGYVKAVLRDIDKPSKSRVVPKCQYYGLCGGCNLQHMTYSAQILWKQIILEEQLTRIAKINSPNVLPTIPSPQIWNYRSRIQVHKKGEVIGFKKRASDEIIEIEECLIAKESVDRKLKSIKNDWPDKETRIEISATEGNVFEQVNECVNGELKSLVTGYIKDLAPKNVMELYAGNGNLTFEYAEHVEHVEASDIDENAIDQANSPFECLAKAKEKGESKNIKFIKKSAEEAVNSNMNPDLVLLDPPRAGLSDGVVKGIIRKTPKHILYISCAPSTLARDIKKFIEVGYFLQSSQPIDMFPQTYHIESLNLLVALHV